MSAQNTPIQLTKYTFCPGNFSTASLVSFCTYAWCDVGISNLNRKFINSKTVLVKTVISDYQFLLSRTLLETFILRSPLITLKNWLQCRICIYREKIQNFFFYRGWGYWFCYAYLGMQPPLFPSITFIISHNTWYNFIFKCVGRFQAQKS